ncbi:MAG: nucleotidyltransferase domain-containing protein [Promethearchaeia archaeon]
MGKRYSNSVKIKYPPSEKKLTKLLNKNVDGLIQKVPSITKIILYGSYARKEPQYGSDVDLLIVVDHRTKDDFERIYERLYDFSLEFEWAPLIITKKRFEDLKNRGNPFIKEILREGILIWAQ